MAKLLTNKENSDKIRSTLARVKRRVNQALFQTDQEMVDYKYGEKMYLTRLDQIIREEASKIPGADN